MSEPTTKPLTVLHPGTGELVHVLTADHLLQVAGLGDLQKADVNTLASFVDDLAYFSGISRDASSLVNDELLRRLDRRGKWTLREAGFTIKAPSPDAGVTAYDTDRLRE